jgi:serine/threonine-protein kinase RsbW
MERVRANILEPEGQSRLRLHLQFPGDEHSVRAALRIMVSELHKTSHNPELLSTAELVLAEVLNNVVEHAYADHSDGVIDVELTRLPEELRFCVQDNGSEMPEGVIPAGEAQDLDVALEDLPEGGYGWFLIHELTDGLSYQRENERNELRFRVPIRKHAEGDLL